ncbi:hypothetical protein ACT4Y9_14485 [Acinetobacter baumannii]
MNLDTMDNFIKTNLLKADLMAIEIQLKNTGLKDLSSIILLKQSFITIANLVDFERTIRPIYKENRNLSEIYKKRSDNYEFIKYLRNIFVGHILPELINKSIEWKPELRSMFENMHDLETMYYCNIFILETAINTYTKPDENHKIFASETDLLYPPDYKRFLGMLFDSIDNGIEYLGELSNILKESENIQENNKTSIEYAIKAGETKFSYIKK